MAKREKIIVFFAILAVAYGGYELLSSSSSKKLPVKTDEKEAKSSSSAAADNIKNELERIALQKDIYIVREASVPWSKDPFSDLPVESESVVQQNKIALEALKHLSYLGYMEVGEKVFAIINGMEYEAGEELPIHNGCVISDISPFQIIIKIKGGEEITIPLTEEQ